MFETNKVLRIFGTKIKRFSVCMPIAPVVRQFVNKTKEIIKEKTVIQTVTLKKETGLPSDGIIPNPNTMGSAVTLSKEREFQSEHPVHGKQSVHNKTNTVSHDSAQFTSREDYLQVSKVNRSSQFVSHLPSVEKGSQFPVQRGQFSLSQSQTQNSRLSPYLQNDVSHVIGMSRRNGQIRDFYPDQVQNVYLDIGRNDQFGHSNQSYFILNNKQVRNPSGKTFSFPPMDPGQVDRGGGDRSRCPCPACRAKLQAQEFCPDRGPQYRYL